MAEGKDRWVFKWSELGEDEVYFDQGSDPAIPHKKDAGYTWDISRILQRAPYSGSGTMQELMELEENMRNLIEENKFGYKYIENMLVSMGYSLNKIKKVFKKLTGVEPDVYLDHQAFLDTPASIPQINYGWGESKDQKFDFYFIMPWVSEYCVFGQKGDTERELISKHINLDDAYAALKKKVKDVYTYDRQITPKDIKKYPKERAVSTEDFPFGTKLAETLGVKEACDEALIKYRYTPDDVDKVMRKFVVSRSEAEKLLQKHTPAELGVASRILLDVKKATDEKEPTGNAKVDVGKELQKQTFFDEQAEAEFLNETAMESIPIADIFAQIVTFVDTIKQKLTGYKLDIKGLKFVSQDIQMVDQTPTVRGIEVNKSSFEVPGVFTVSLVMESGDVKKKGLAVFLYSKDGELITDGTFKGQDSKIYALSDEGLDAYFGKKRI